MRLGLLVFVVLVGAGLHALSDGEAEDAWSEVVEVEDTYTVKAERG